jgi:hypothetical protein
MVPCPRMLCLLYALAMVILLLYKGKVNHGLMVNHQHIVSHAKLAIHSHGRSAIMYLFPFLI